MKYRLFGILGIMLTVVFAAGPSNAATVPAGCKSKQLVTKSSKPYSQVTVALSEGAIDGVWRVKQIEWLKEDIEACGAKFVVTDGQGRGDKNLADIEDLVAKNVDIIVVSTYFADEIVPGIQLANKKGIPVVVLSSDLGRGADYQTFITADNRQIAYAAADWVLKNFANKDKINVIELMGREGSVAAKLRSEGFREKLQTPKVNWVANVTAHYMRAEAMRVMEDLIKANPKPGSIDVVYAANDEMALGAILALKDANRLSGVKVMGIDGILCEAYDAIKRGEEAVDFFYPNFAPEGAEAVFKILNGEPVQKNVVVASTAIDRSNVDKFYPRCAK